MTAPNAAAQLTLAGLDALTDAELSERIDYHLRRAMDPNCSISAAPGVWMQVSALLGERTARTATCATEKILSLTKVMTVLTAAVTIATVVGVIATIVGLLK